VISILLVEDQLLVRSGLKILLDREPDLRIVAEAGDGEEAVRLSAELKYVELGAELDALTGGWFTKHLVRKDAVLGKKSKSKKGK